MSDPSATDHVGGPDTAESTGVRAVSADAFESTGTGTADAGSADAGIADAGAADSEARRERHPLLVAGVLALLIGAMAAVMLASHRSGHWWGDDFALYIRQAQSLVDGNPGEITADNHFTVEQSLGQPFSPPLYPWGFPMILAPFVAIVGTDVDALRIVPVLSACVFACAWFGLARRRVGLVAAYVGTIAATLTPVLLAWSELIQSEWPFTAVVFTTLLGIDRAIESRVLVDTSARLWPLALLGLGAAAAFSVRREGFAMTPAIGAAQLGLLTTGSPRLSDLVRDARLAVRILTPHLSALAGVLTLQWALPSTLVPEYDGTGVHNVWGFWYRHVRHLADVSGIKRHWDRDPVVLGSVALGWSMVVLYLLAASVGIVLAFRAHRRRDLHLVVYAVVAFVIGASFRSAIRRYVVTVAPILFLLGLVAVVALAGRRRPTLGRFVATVAAGAITIGNLANAHLRLQSAERVAEDGAIEWGPTHPAAIEMFDYVIDETDADDVVAGPKARALTLVTDRRAIQVDTARPLPTEWAPALVVTESGSPTEATMLAEHADRYTLVWSNSRFSVFAPLD